MALAYPMPSYGKRDILIEKNRFNSAPPDVRYLRKMIKSIDDQEFSQIKHSAKKSFKGELDHRNASATCYGGMHAEKILDEPTQTRIRPSSGSRKNNPHPPEVFLVNRLRHIPGYYQPEKVNESEKLSARELSERSFKSFVKTNQIQINQAMGLPTPQKRPFTAHTTLQERAEMQEVAGQIPAQAAEAWLKLCPEKDRVAIRRSFRTPQATIRSSEVAKNVDIEGRTSLRSGRGQLGYLKARASQELDSTAKWLQQNGCSKNESLQRLSQSMRKAPPAWHSTLNNKKTKSTNKSAAFDSSAMPLYLDFQIHPQWHMAWHKQYDTRAPRHPPHIYA